MKLFQRKKSIEDQIRILAECGIRLRPGMTIDHLLISWPREDFEKEPFQLALVSMGGEAEDGNFERISNDVWHFDTECIEDHGAYVRIAERVRDLAKGDLPITDISDVVDIEAGIAILEFRLKGQTIKWNLTVDDDWVDPKIFDRFQKLLEQCGSKRRLTYLDLGGQDCIIGCATPEELAAQTKATGLKFEWMT